MAARIGDGQPQGERSLHVVPDRSREPIELSVVIPAFNEGMRVGGGLAELAASIERHELGRKVVEVLVVDDGSTDDTVAEVERHRASFAHLRIIRLSTNTGKGAAVRAGVAEAAGAMVAFMDADMAVDPSTLPELLARLDRSGMAIGSRALPGSSTEHASLDRIVLGRTFNRIVAMLTGLRPRDTQCGFKAFQAPIARILFHYSKVDRYAFDVDLLLTARRFGVGVAEVPVHWRQVVGSHIRPLSDPFRMMADTLSLRWGRPPAVAMQAVAITGTRGTGVLADAARETMGPTLPISPWDGDGVLVLFPLCDAQEVERGLRQLEQRFPTSTVHQVSLTMAEVAPLIPSLLAVPTGSPVDADALHQSDEFRRDRTGDSSTL